MASVTVVMGSLFWYLTLANLSKKLTDVATLNVHTLFKVKAITLAHTTDQERGSCESTDDGVVI